MGKKSQFIEGLIAGIILGIAGGFFFFCSKSHDCHNSEDDGETNESTHQNKSDVMVTKTLEAIESGFEKLGAMVDKNASVTDSDSQPKL